MFNADGLGPAPQEPSGDARKGAMAIRQLHIALVDSGFTPTEAMQLVIGMLAAQIAQNKATGTD